VRFLVGLEVLARHPLRRRVTAHAVLLGAPVVAAATSVDEVEQLLAGEAVVANIANRALGAGLVLRVTRRVGSTWKPRTGAYSRKPSMMRGLRGSAVCTIARVQSGTTTPNTPP